MLLKEVLQKVLILVSYKKNKNQPIHYENFGRLIDTGLDFLLLNF